MIAAERDRLEAPKLCGIPPHRPRAHDLLDELGPLVAGVFAINFHGLVRALDQNDVKVGLFAGNKEFPRLHTSDEVQPTVDMQLDLSQKVADFQRLALVSEIR